MAAGGDKPLSRIPRTFRLDRVVAASPVRGQTFQLDLLPLVPDLVHAGVDPEAFPQPAP